jgi:hypothetical protein
LPRSLIHRLNTFIERTPTTWSGCR